MSDRPTCPEHGAIRGLGKCQAPGCDYDAREPSAKSRVATQKLSESQIQQQIKDALHLHGYRYVDTSQPRATMMTPGLSDLIVFGDNRHCYAEIKTPSGRQSEHQKEFERLCEQAGADYQLWRSVEDAVAWMGGGP